MTLRDLSAEEVKRLQAQCKDDFVATRSSSVDIPFNQYEKIWSRGLKGGLALFDKTDVTNLFLKQK